MTIPYRARQEGPGGKWGTATPLHGASEPAFNEYYPAFSPDDKLIAFNRVRAGGSMYQDPEAQIYVVPFNDGKGGTAVRLAANDPVACTGLASPGVQSTWPKWAPSPSHSGGSGASNPETIDGSTYYWITFSSTRSVEAGAMPGAPGNAQIYVAGVVVDNTGQITTFAPIYRWNQDGTVDNLMPAWAPASTPTVADAGR